ncbi:MAG: hypothetical protein HKN68_00655 [Saprospiraceae bacterium]|nr:hypothetical protein [Saprospiraceae bacterium]
MHVYINDNFSKFILLKAMVDSKIAIYRLTALWAFAECGIGGVLHAFKLPITGLVVGGIAITILSIIRALSGSDFRKNILQALAVVIVIKATITPHAGITAYLAVAFQGISAVIFYSLIPSFKIGTILHCMVSMIESALQKVLVLLVLYGETLLKAIDKLGSWVSSMLDVPVDTISMSLISGYTVFFALWGLFIAWMAIRLTKVIQSVLNKERYTIEISKSSETLMGARRRKRKGWLILLLILVALLIYSFFIEQEANGWILLFRVIVVMIVFYKVIGPLLARALASFIKKYRASNTSYMQYVLDALPYTGVIAKKAWKENNHRPFLGKIRHFMIDVIMYQLYFIPK